MTWPPSAAVMVAPPLWRAGTIVNTTPAASNVPPTFIPTASTPMPAS